MNHVPNEQVEDLKVWLKGTGSHFLVLNTEEHDYVTGSLVISRILSQQV